VNYGPVNSLLIYHKIQAAGKDNAISPPGNQLIRFVYPRDGDIYALFTSGMLF